MALSTATCDILKICKPLLEENRDAIGATFYRKLFSEHPGLRNTFNMSHQRPPAEGEPPLTGAQQLALGNALVAYCANCDQLDKLGPFVERVANKHVSFNVQPEQVDTYITYIHYIYNIYNIYTICSTPWWAACCSLPWRRSWARKPLTRL